MGSTGIEIGVNRASMPGTIRSRRFDSAIDYCKMESLVNIAIPSLGSVNVPHGTTVCDVIEECGIQNSAGAPVAAVFNSEYVALDYPLTLSGDLRFIYENDEESLRVLWITAAQLTAQAVMNIRPDIRPGIGRTTSDGFVCMFLTEDPEPLATKPRITEEIRRMVAENRKIGPEILDVWAIKAETSEHMQRVTGIPEKTGAISPRQVIKPVNLIFPTVQLLPSNRVRHFSILSIDIVKRSTHKQPPIYQTIYGTASFIEKDLGKNLGKLDAIISAMRDIVARRPGWQTQLKELKHLLQVRAYHLDVVRDVLDLVQESLAYYSPTRHPESSRGVYIGDDELIRRFSDYLTLLEEIDR